MKPIEAKDITPAVTVKVLIEEAKNVEKRITVLGSEYEDENVDNAISKDLIRLKDYYFMLCQRIGRLVVAYGSAIEDTTKDINIDDIYDDWEFK